MRVLSSVSRASAMISATHRKAPRFLQWWAERNGCPCVRLAARAILGSRSSAAGVVGDEPARAGCRAGIDSALADVEVGAVPKCLARWHGAICHQHPTARARVGGWGRAVDPPRSVVGSQRKCRGSHGKPFRAKRERGRGDRGGVFPSRPLLTMRRDWRAQGTSERDWRAVMEVSLDAGTRLTPPMTGKTKDPHGWTPVAVFNQDPMGHGARECTASKRGAREVKKMLFCRHIRMLLRQTKS